jgi:hypothetical protein
MRSSSDFCAAATVATAAAAVKWPTCDITISPMPSSISSVDTLCVELPSPLSTLDMPTMQMPACKQHTQQQQQQRKHI